MARLALSSPSSLTISRHQIPAHNLIPNTSIQNRPLVIYHSCLPSSATASSIESHLKDVGIVSPQWRYTMYRETDFHSTTHEVLCISSGTAMLCFGGETNPGKVEIKVSEGDVIIIPAGVSHRLLDDFGSGFQMVGSYPLGHDWDMCYGKAGEERKINGINRLSWFKQDPLYGDDGPALND